MIDKNQVLSLIEQQIALCKNASLYQAESILQGLRYSVQMLPEGSNDKQFIDNLIGDVNTEEEGI